MIISEKRKKFLVGICSYNEGNKIKRVVDKFNDYPCYDVLIVDDGSSDGSLDFLTGDLPLGQKQIIALVSAIIHRPPVIFLDEPTSGVDPISRRNFWRIIRGLADNGTTVFVTTHFMEEAEYCDRISIMHNGKIIALDSPEQLKIQTDTQTIQELFIKLVRSRK